MSYGHCSYEGEREQLKIMTYANSPPLPIKWQTAFAPGSSQNFCKFKFMFLHCKKKLDDWHASLISAPTKQDHSKFFKHTKIILFIALL